MAASGAAAIPLKGTGLLRMAGEQPQVLVPADKGLSASWIAGLSKRGKPTVYRGKALGNIGMPIGGIGCGQVYLGGDGQLWHWDVFNQLAEADMGEIRNGLHYSHPLPERSPFSMGFYLAKATKAGDLLAAFDLTAFPDTAFLGRYPMADIHYGEFHQIDVRLEAYSPFIPLNEDDSGLPMAILSYAVKNTGSETAEVELAGWMENPVCLYSRNRRLVQLKTDARTGDGLAFFQHSGSDAEGGTSGRPVVVFEDFEKASYEGWTVEGTAFGEGPIEISKIPQYQGDVRGKGKRVVNSHNVRHGENVSGGDAHLGRLLSREFTVERRYISMLIGGGEHAGKTCVNLLVDGHVVRTATGQDANAMSWVNWDVRDLEGKKARIEILDAEAGPWGNVGVDQIEFRDEAVHEVEKLGDEGDFGTIGIGVLGKGGATNAGVRSWKEFAATYFTTEAPRGVAGKRVRLKPGETQTVTFLVSWHFPNPNRKSLSFLEGHETFKRYYAKRFSDAREVAVYAAKNFVRLSQETRRWTETWYDSTLPYWFLDRTMANTSTLSTSTCYRFDDGRFYGWEGVYCCAGTCTHVWQYAQAMGRLFPALERDLRTRVDYGIAYHENGALGHRAEAAQGPATDGQCGTILRVYREHLMSKDSGWLKAFWPRVKQSIRFLIEQDPNQDGILEGPQFNTLDATWFGKISWISSLYVATLRAGEAMAADMGDATFSSLCRTIAERGSRHLVDELFNGEYFIQKTDTNHPRAINTNNGCHIDQVFGQSWAWQVGLPRVVPPTESKKALEALYRYNYAPDVGKYRQSMKDIRGGRWYALPGEAGLLMCTWPRGGSNKAPGEGQEDWAVGYFNECMTGFEHQVAGHMIYEGMVDQGLIVERTIHERYRAERRNPYNEIECSDHYARAMASYGVYLAACGFEYDGPKGWLTIRPRIGAEDFRGAFTVAEGWGRFSQTASKSGMTVELVVKWGKLRLSKLVLSVGSRQLISAIVGNLKAPAVLNESTGEVIFKKPIDLATNDRIVLTFK